MCLGEARTEMHNWGEFIQKRTWILTAGWHLDHCDVVLNQTRIVDVQHGGCLCVEVMWGPLASARKALFLLCTDCDTPCCETAQPLNLGVVGVVFVGEESTGERWWCCP